MIDIDSMSDDDKLAALESIHKSISESKEIQKQKIAANVNLVLQSLKKMESDIRARYDETGKVIEKRVANIKDGRDGRNGIDGKPGRDGRNGKDGATGPRGLDGLNGSNGIDGEDGISVSNAHIDFDGSLIITLSDGRELNVGEVVSQDVVEKLKIITSGGAGGGGGSGTVSSVAISGGTTGLTTSGGPITTSGTVTLAGTLAVANGGTGTTTPSLVAGTNVTVTGTWPNQTVTASGGSGSVTSVAATVPSIFSISGSPITTSGTLAMTYSGTALPVVNGGTGQTTYTDGQLLIGNTTGSTLTKTTLTAGSGVTITNGSGSITIAASGGTGDVVGPASSTDNAITRFDSTTGKLLQNSLVTVADDGAITAPQVGSVIPFYYANQAAFPSAATYHGALAHSHSDVAMYFAHGGNWNRLLDALTAVTPAQGGTGQTTYTNGQLLIGNTTGNTLTKSTLTAGTGITITNSTGSITIASTGGSTDLLENVQTIASNYTVTASKNALAVGPITINTGISVTVGTGQRWLILN